ncbi:hypothetical protein AG0111_0g1920 [Alternaria gaisen]|uniref:Uncharacterized protein n=1 Tax=Alternaria gaisen TaxID=167740 RepID=A0ACB6G2L1_9PLEO|nr:hypothetical protein AG0111_0g1920 [Alternaria gaisen]
MAAVAPGAEPPQPPGKGGMGPLPPPDKPDAPPLPDDQNPICRICGEGKDISDVNSLGKYKKICRTCRGKGYHTVPKNLTGSMRRKRKETAPPLTPNEAGPKRTVVSKFLPRGKDSQDTPEMAAARAEQDRIRREHWVEPRGGGEPASTPSPEALMARAAGGSVSSPLSSAPPGLLSPQTPRRLAPQPPRLSVPSGTVGEVFTPYEETPSPMSFRRPSLPTLQGRGGDRRSQNTTPTSSRRPSLIKGSVPGPAPDISVDVGPMGHYPSPDGVSFECDVCSMLRHNRRRKDPDDLSLDECYYEDDDGQSGRERELNAARLTDKDPELDNEFDDDWKEEPALNPADWEDLQSFHVALEQEHMQTCTRCNERWFTMKLNSDGVCKGCSTQDSSKKRSSEEPFLYSAANDMDPGAVPSHLPALSPIEEMCIARAHCFVEVRQHRGVQHKYRGHICNFLSNVGKVYDLLPRLPRELDVVVIRPGNHVNVPGIARQFKHEYRVRKGALRVWLDYLVVHHPGYRDVHIDQDRLDAIQDSDDVSNELLDHLVEDENETTLGSDDDGNEDDFGPIPEAAAVPDLSEVDAELAGIRRALDLDLDEVHDIAPVQSSADEEEELAGRHPKPVAHLSPGTIRRS